MKYFFGILASLLLIVLLPSCVNSETSTVDSSEEKPEVMRFMSYNIHIANPPSQPSDVVDIAAIAKVINDVKPDFVALQEVDRFTDRSGKDLDQAEAIAKLTGMKHAFIKAINRSNGEYGLAILSKYEIQESKTFSLPVNQGTGAELRTLGIIRVELGEGRNLLFGTTHLDHLQDSNRELQTREALKYLEPYQEYPIVLGGDFNMNQSNSIWDIWKTDFYVPCTNCPSTAPAIKPTTAIDFLIMNQKAKSMFNVTSYRIFPEDYASDHLPVVMEVEINK